MEWFQVLTIILSIAGITYWFKSELEKDINRIDTDLKSIRTEMKADMLASSQRADLIHQGLVEDGNAHKERTDKLYQMFVDLLTAQILTTKPPKPKTDP